MPSTFFGLTIAYSGVTAYQAALNTTGNNMANVETKGYTRQVVNRQAAQGLRTYQRYGMVGAGVDALSIDQIRDVYYDNKYWDNNAKSGQYDMKLYYMNEVQDNFEEENKKGMSAGLSDFSFGIQELLKGPDQLTNRNQFIGFTKSFADNLNASAIELKRIQQDTNDEIKIKVDQINSLAQRIAGINKQINIIEMSGSNANELRDERALLVDELSAIVPIKVKEEKVPSGMNDKNGDPMYHGGTYYTVTIQGEELVSTYDYKTLSTTPRKDKVNQSDVDGLYDIQWSNGNAFNIQAGSMDGELRALIDMRDGNNAENFRGLGTGAIGDSEITISGANITDINRVNMAAKGTINIGGKEYGYTGFSYDSVNNTYKFQLEKPLTQSVSNTTVKIGESVNYKGIPFYMQRVNEFTRIFAEQMNNIQLKGKDNNGDPGMNLFSAQDLVDSSQEIGYTAPFQKNPSFSTSDPSNYYFMTAENIRVASGMKPDKLSTSVNPKAEGVSNDDLVREMEDLMKNKAMYESGTPLDFVRAILTDVSMDTARVEKFSQNYENIKESITSQRLSISGVDKDEEGMDLIKFENAYKLSARMVTVMTQIYDKLINEMGV